MELPNFVSSDDQSLGDRILAFFLGCSCLILNGFMSYAWLHLDDSLITGNTTLGVQSSFRSRGFSSVKYV